MRTFPQENLETVDVSETLPEECAIEMKAKDRDTVSLVNQSDVTKLLCCTDYGMLRGLLRVCFEVYSPSEEVSSSETPTSCRSDSR